MKQLKCEMCGSNDIIKQDGMANITNPSDLKAKQAVIAYRDKHNL